MIFKQGLIDMILAGVKTQTRRPHRGYYKVGSSYSIQPCRACKGIEGVRILMRDIHEEIGGKLFAHNFYDNPESTKLTPVTHADAAAEGFESSFSFEREFQELYPRWDREARWVYTFRLIKMGDDEKE